MQVEGTMLAAAAIAGAVASFAVVKAAQWLPRRIDAEWLEGAKEAAEAEPMAPVRIGRIERLLIAVLAAGLCGGSVMMFGTSPAAALGCALSLALLVACVIDFHTMMLPDDITLPLLWLGLLANSSGLFIPAQASIIGAVAGYVVLWLIYWAFKLLTGREGMGYGDFKLLAAIGAWVGWSSLPAVALVAGVSGAVLALIAWVMAGCKKSVPVPFGPHLAIGGLAAFFAIAAGNNPVELVMKLVAFIL